MPDKEAKFHITAAGADQAKRQTKDVANSVKDLGDKTNEAGKKGAAGTDKSTKKLMGMGRVLTSLKSQVAGFITAWLGLQGVQKIITYLIEKLERVKQLQADIYQKSLSLAEVGQALEFQTGTAGKQQHWSRQAAMLQEAGGLPDISTAQSMMISGDIAFSAQGGIKNPKIMAMLKQIAPFAGTAGMTGDEVAKAFEFGGTAGIDRTPEAYSDYFAQLHAGYTASKADRFGPFMVGLQKGGTAYMSQGGSLVEAISSFASARAVTSNEALAANLLEQTARLSGGAYAKPRQSIERGLGVSWSDLTMDQRKSALLQHVSNIPESSRAEVLTAQGFPVELSTQIGKLVTPEAQDTLVATRQKVAAADRSSIDPMVQSYMQTDLAKQRQLDAQKSLMDLDIGPAFASWQRRIEKTKKAHDILVATGKDPTSSDRIQPYATALEEIVDELKEVEPSLTGDDAERAAIMKRKLYTYINAMSDPFIGRFFYSKGYASARGQEFTEQLTEFQDAALQTPAATVIHNDHSINNYPVAGSDADRGIGGRFKQ